MKICTFNNKCFSEQQCFLYQQVTKQLHYPIFLYLTRLDQHCQIDCCALIHYISTCCHCEVLDKTTLVQWSYTKPIHLELVVLCISNRKIAITTSSIGNFLVVYISLSFFSVQYLTYNVPQNFKIQCHYTYRQIIRFLSFSKLKYSFMVHSLHSLKILVR